MSKLLSECCDAPIMGEIFDHFGRCSECKEMSWAYDTELAKPISMQELKEVVGKKENAVKLTDAQINDSLNELC